MRHAQDVVARAALSDIVQSQDNAGKIIELLEETPAMLEMLGGPGHVSPLYEAVAAGRVSTTQALVERGAPIHQLHDVTPPIPATPWRRALHRTPPDVHVLAILIESPAASTDDLLTCRDDLGALIRNGVDGARAPYGRVCARMQQPPTVLPPGSSGPRR